MEMKQVTLTPERVIAEASLLFDVAVRDVIGPTRRREVVLARHVAMHFIYRHCRETTAAIGQRFGGRDHSTVVHALRRIDAERYEPVIDQAYRSMEGRFGVGFGETICPRCKGTGYIVPD